MEYSQETLELVLRLSNGALLIPLKRSATIIGREQQTLYNWLDQGKCPMEPHRQNGRIFFRAQDIAAEIDRQRIEQRPRRGRRSKAELARLHG